MFNLIVVLAVHKMFTNSGRVTTCGRRFKASSVSSHFRKKYLQFSVEKVFCMIMIFNFFMMLGIQVFCRIVFLWYKSVNGVNGNAKGVRGCGPCWYKTVDGVFPKLLPGFFWTEILAQFFMLYSYLIKMIFMA